MTKKHRIALLLSGAATAAISAVMNLLLLPRIQAEAGGLKCFDLRFLYGYGDAQQFLDALSEQGRSLYLTRQLPLDLLYPVAYGAFFILLFAALRGGKTPWAVLPACLVLADYCENALVFGMLRTTPPPFALVTFAGTATLLKNVLMYACFLASAVFLLLWLLRRRKSGGRQLTVER